MARHGIERGAVKHWVIHTGGGAVIDSVTKCLGLSEYDVRHTRSVLRDYGNVSSGSFLLSLQRLLNEARSYTNVLKHGDIGVFITMGPGAQLEAALLVCS